MPLAGKVTLVAGMLALPKTAEAGPARVIQLVVSEGGEGKLSSVTVPLTEVEAMTGEVSVPGLTTGALFIGTTEKLVNVAVFKTEPPPELSTASPTITGVVMMTVCGWPRGTQTPGLPLESGA